MALYFLRSAHPQPGFRQHARLDAIVDVARVKRVARHYFEQGAPRKGGGFAQQIVDGLLIRHLFERCDGAIVDAKNEVLAEIGQRSFEAHERDQGQLLGHQDSDDVDPDIDGLLGNAAEFAANEFNGGQVLRNELGNPTKS